MTKGVKWGAGKWSNGRILPGPRSSYLPPASKADQQAVLAVFDASQAQGINTVDCYKAAKAEWKKRHPDHTEEYSANQAVAIILNHRITLYPPE